MTICQLTFIIFMRILYGVYLFFLLKRAHLPLCNTLIGHLIYLKIPKNGVKVNPKGAFLQLFTFSCNIGTPNIFTTFYNWVIDIHSSIMYIINVIRNQINPYYYEF